MPEDVQKQEPAPQEGAPAESQKGTPQEGAPDLEARLRELEQERERLLKERDWLRKEVERNRRENAERRLTARTLEERVAELEQRLQEAQRQAERVAELEKRWQEAERQAKLAETRARLYAVIGPDEARVNAALVLMEREGLEDPKVLLERYPFLRSVPPAPGPANPGGGARRLTASEIARMSPEEYARRRTEILQAMARGEIAPE
jgi:predicted RNase H-like nuclease (RuvC/YqgF family)